jgi:PAS domain S-box-containing protein
MVDMKKLFDDEQTLLFESLRVGLAINDLEGNLLYVNQAYADLIGYTKEEVMQLSYWDITPTKYNEQEQVQLKSITTNGYYGPYDKEYIHKDGYLIPVRLNGKIVNIKGTDYLWSSVEDCRFTNSISLNSELASKSDLIENSANEILIFNYKDFKFVYANKSAQQNLKFSTDELKEMTLLNLMPSFDEKAFVDLLVTLKNGSSDKVAFETLIKRKDDSMYNADIKIQPGRYMGTNCFIFFSWDTTKLQKA